MIRERMVRAVLRAYPRPERESLGPEIESTVLDAGPTSRWTFARELLNLARYGLNRRAGRIASAGTGRVIADGVCNGATWIMVLDLSTLLVWRLTGTQNALTVWWSMAMLALVLAAAFYGYDRVAGLGALAWVAVRVPELASVTTVTQWLPPMVVAVACFLVMVFFPRRRTPDLRRLGWLAVPVWLIATFVAGGHNNSVVFVELLLVVAGVLLAALASLPTDPRLAMTAMTPVLYATSSFSPHDGVMALIFPAVAAAIVGSAVLRLFRVRARSAT